MFQVPKSTFQINSFLFPKLIKLLFFLNLKNIKIILNYFFISKLKNAFFFLKFIYLVFINDLVKLLLNKKKMIDRIVNLND